MEGLMSKKLYTLVSTIVSAAGTVATAIIAYVQPGYTPAIVAAIGLGVTAINEIAVQFVDDKTAAK